MIEGQPLKVAIATPVMDTVKAMFAYDLARMVGYTAAHRPDIQMQMLMATGSLIMKQRQTIADSVIERSKDTTHILWLDSDLRFPKETLIRLLDHHVEVVLGAYTERKPPFKPAVFIDSNDFSQRAWPTEDATGLRQVVAAGFGCVLTETSVFTQMKKPYFHVGWSPVSESFLGEDIYFFLQLSKLGVPAWLDQDLTKELAHIGEFEFTPMHAIQAEARREQEAAATEEPKQ